MYRRFLPEIHLSISNISNRLQYNIEIDFGGALMHLLMLMRFSLTLLSALDNIEHSQEEEEGGSSTTCGTVVVGRIDNDRLTKIPIKYAFFRAKQELSVSDATAQGN